LGLLSAVADRRYRGCALSRGQLRKYIVLSIIVDEHDYCEEFVDMRLVFTNRVRELEALDASARVGGLVVLFGRRRVGKTRLLTHWLEKRSGVYSQAHYCPAIS
jgi:hypothetical protein